ncbi:tRNA dihydrouridine synthase DusB [Natranaerobius trueperi]|uniref:tRNA dihydrouridine synthase DusB n=1 Tax=Natranaerobius trueperi TaxID=759412 RepID=UPI00197B0B33|nr:tRNA dihydrouridine synthase DusB [Natranaerobius trueperi]
MDNPVIFAPMAGVSDLPYRKIIAKFKPGLICGEMVSSKGLLQQNKKTRKMVSHHNHFVPFSQQIFGKDPDLMAKAAKEIEKLGVDIIDINMGCPAPKITKIGEGSALLKTPDIAVEIVRKVVSSVKTPVTVKMRKGFDNYNCDVLELANRIQEQNVVAIAIHGRTCEQQYSGTADWDIITKFKEELDIPVIGNGDIFRPEDAKEMLSQTGCDAVMIGRGTMGNPWLIDRVKKEINEEPHYSLKKEEFINVINDHFREAINYYGEHGVVHMRKHIAWYLKGLPNNARIKEKIMKETDKNTVWNILNEYIEEIY